jgi:hypothetical protein
MISQESFFHYTETRAVATLLACATEALGYGYVLTAHQPDLLILMDRFRLLQALGTTSRLLGLEQRHDCLSMAT